MAATATALNTAQGIARQLREKILSGALKPSTRLTQRELVAEYGHSPMPARDAIKMLLAEGLVVQESSKTILVAPVNPDDFISIMEIRGILEPHALELAIPKMTMADLAHSRSMLALSGSTNEPLAFVENHWKFHRSLYERSGRLRLLALIEQQHTHLIRYLMPNWAEIGVLPDWAEDESELMELVDAGEVSRAVVWLRDDLRETTERVLSAFPR